MIEVITPIYRDETATELNEKIEELLHNLEAENEGVMEVIMDITLDQSERREKSYWEIVRNPENHQELIKLQSRNHTLDFIISELKSIIYSDYESKPLKEEKSPEPRMSKEECQIWLGTTVKPLILEGELKQQNISDKLGVGASTISTRVKSGYNKSWRDYVELVNQGIY